MTIETRTVETINLGTGADSESFLVVSLDGRLSVVPLPDGVPVTIGRSRACTVWVEDDRVSRRHAHIVRRGGAVVVTDLSSRNGTRLGGARVEGERNAQAGDVIDVGPLRAVVALATAPKTSYGEPPALGPYVVADPAMARVYDLCHRVAATPMSVLVVGETGVGKEHVAEAIHRLSPRAERTFVRLHIGALPEALIESELFGHEKGAFTGADKRRPGYFESAAGSTLFLDEIGELPTATQAKLLRTIETRRVTRIGSTEEIEVDVRIVSATNRDLLAEIRLGKFREDLYFRLSAFRIDVPPLRERPTEVPLLAALFVREMASCMGRAPPPLDPEVLSLLSAYAWPGNVRELKHTLEAAFVLAAPGPIAPGHFPASIRAATQSLTTPAAPAAAAAAPPADLHQAVLNVERAAIVAALKACGGNQTKAAERLGISRRTLIYKMRQHAIKAVRTIE